MGLHTGLISGMIVTGTDMPSLLLPGLLIKSDLGSRAWIRIGGRLVRDSDPHSQLEQTSNHRDMDPQYAIVDQLVEIIDTMASIRDAILGLGQRIDGHQAQPLPISGSTPLTLPHLQHHHHHLDPLYSRTTQFHLHHHHHHLNPLYSRTTQFHLHHPHHYLDPMYSRTIQFHPHHHHWFNQPRRLELLFYMVRLGPYHIML